MAIIALKAWYIEQYEPLKEIIKKPHTIRLSRNSLLKSALRVDILDDRTIVEASDWFSRYLTGETVEFYIEGSGNYIVSNVDLVSQEIYFTKKEVLATLDPVIYYSPQGSNGEITQATTAIVEQTVAKLSMRSRIPLSLEITPRPQDSPLRLSDSQLRKIRKSLLFIADATPIASIPGENNTSLILDSNVCVEIGYAIHSKDNGQILLLKMEKPDLAGKLPFDVSGYKQLNYSTTSELQKTLPKLTQALLQKFNLF
ncbi:MAG: hypothetical protein ACFCU5_10875 [Pleurocapsa sp.]